MRLSSIGVRNVARNKFRNTLTIVGVGIAILTFVLLQTVLVSWTSAAKYAAQDRVATRHKVSFIMTMPLRYGQEILQVPGVTKSMYASWFGAKDAKHPNEFFATIAVQTETFFDVYDEIVVNSSETQSWRETKKGAIVGDVLAKKLGWKVGDRIRLQGTIYPGDWEFVISGIYTAKRRSIDRSTLFFHYDYMNDAIPQRMKDKIGWIVSRIQDPSQAANISTAIDRHFEERDIQTLSQSERALNTSFLGMVSTVLKALDLVSGVIMVIMLLILGNTIAMGVRERTHEYGVMRAIGFLPKHIAGFVFGEAMFIGTLGGLFGVGLAYPLVEQGVGRFIEENMGGFFPYFRIELGTIVTALVLSLLLGFLAAGLPAYRAAKLNVVDSLRRVG
ncbi:MAG TPA: FtsX-like permease family protein [Polyangiaceae bacterium]